MASNDESEVLAICAGFLDCLKTKHLNKLHDFMEADGHIAMRRYDPEGKAMLTHLSLGALVNRLKHLLVERQWLDKEVEETFEEPQVMIDEDLAICWTKFRVLVDGEETAKGRNCFCLHKIEGKGWRITGAVDRNISV